MYRKLVISETPHETRVALLEDGTIVELFIERGDDSDVTGNIYKGRVQRVLPGIQAAFVDIGLNQAAFIYVDDVACHQTKEFDPLVFPDQNGGEEVFDPEENELSSVHLYRQFQIEDLITEGQEITVQVAKSPIGTVPRTQPMCTKDPLPAARTARGHRSRIEMKLCACNAVATVQLESRTPMGRATGLFPDAKACAPCALAMANAAVHKGFHVSLKPIDYERG